jgi:hypothetical protein
MPFGALLKQTKTMKNLKITLSEIIVTTIALLIIAFGIYFSSQGLYIY